MVEVIGTANGVSPLVPRVLWGLAPRYCIDNGVRISECLFHVSGIGAFSFLDGIGLYPFTSWFVCFHSSGEWEH